MIEATFGSALALIVALLLVMIRWMQKVLNERDRLQDQALVSKIDARLEPRFRKIEDALLVIKGRMVTHDGDHTR